MYINKVFRISGAGYVRSFEIDRVSIQHARALLNLHAENWKTHAHMINRHEPRFAKLITNQNRGNLPIYASNEMNYPKPFLEYSQPDSVTGYSLRDIDILQPVIRLNITSSVALSLDKKLISLRAKSFIK